MTDKFKLVLNVPKTYEQFVLDNQYEQNQDVADSYAAEFGAYGDAFNPSLSNIRLAPANGDAQIQKMA
ncbi:13450_t:CDS:2 [Ambispora gerdemannii]|uniref:13450_t:CDS:1 n=1 Tax=Ambispora gerdemannii TaxID=144530 RepID=A0A9N8YVM0_9GLOM|nr:13450_t:CDS:2 [Ambispora gerdemannii]